MCFVGNASTSWLHGVITEGFVAEFIKKPPGDPKEVAKPTHYITTTGRTRSDIPISGNYHRRLSTFAFGPAGFRKACKSLYMYVIGELSASADYLDMIVTIIILHLWDTSRNNDVLDKALMAFHPDNTEQIVLGDDCRVMLQRWKRVSCETVSSIDERRDYVPIAYTTPKCVSKACDIIRILYGEVHDHSPFDDKFLPLSFAAQIDSQSDDENDKSGHGRIKGNYHSKKGDKTYPSWIVKRCSAYGFAQNDSTHRVHRCLLHANKIRCNSRSSVYIFWITLIANYTNIVLQKCTGQCDGAMPS